MNRSQTRNTHRTIGRALLALAVVAVLSAPLSAGVIKESRQFTGQSLEVRNLIGEVKVEGHSGKDFIVEITIQGADANEGLISIEDTGDTLTLVFPREGSFVYPRLGSGSRTNISMSSDSNGWLSDVMGSLMKRGRIEVRGSGSGIEVWADLVIKVPAGRELTVLHGVGEVKANDVDGDVDLRVRSGHASARKINGKTVVDTGSGHVVVEDIRGNLLVDTGSGHVEASRIDGDDVNIDTGSGHVEIDDVRTRMLRVDTGSGRVDATAVSTDAANIDTGSGGVRLQLDRMGTGNFRIDTGSGGIRLDLPSDASAEFEAETGSGGIDIDIAGGVEMRRKERNSARFSVGGGGGARVVLDTGSGGIRIRQ